MVDNESQHPVLGWNTSIIDHIKHKRSSRRKTFTNREYHVQHNKDFDHQHVKIYCATNQFPELKFLGTHNKQHDVRGLVKHNQVYFDTKLGHSIYAIRRIPCACTSCTSILDQT